MSDHAVRGQGAFERRAWSEAFEELMAADGELGLDVPDLERLAISAYLVGRPEDSVSTWERTHRSCARAGAAAQAARCAFWLAFIHLNRGDLSRGNGWIHRGQRMLDQDGLDCVERGYLRYCTAMRLVFDGDVDGADAGFAEAATIGERFRSAELVALALVGRGRCRIRAHDVEGGMALLDEAMVAVTADDVSPTAVGDLYCTVIEGCQETFDVRRAQEWTAALSQWCDAQPELVLYRGQCLVHRAELMLLAGEWSAAVAELQRARDRLTRPRSHPALGAAHYVRAELHRLQGENAEAEAAYDQASACGRRPHPGLAQLWLAQGRIVDAQTALRRGIEEAADDRAARSRLLGPYVEATLAAGDLAAARASVDELAGLAAARNTPYLTAVAAQALGSVHLADGDPGAALAELRRAWSGWSDLETPHEAARVRALMAEALRALGDEQGAGTELAAAEAEVARLGGSLTLLRSAFPRQAKSEHTAPGDLSPREIEVLRLVATGVTNRAVAAKLVISEKTVATHVSSILHKLDLPSRAAATAYAHQHRLL